MYNILVCDDDEAIVRAIEIYLSNQGYKIYKAYNGLEAIDILEKIDIHLVILDIMMPKLNGIDTLKKISEKYSVPVLMLSAKSEIEDEIECLNLGADDYITKPFDSLKLIARVNSKIRRYNKMNILDNNQNKNVYITGELELDDNEKKVFVDGQNIKLTPTEFNILKFLIQNQGKVYSIEEIYKNVWNEDAYGAENIIAVHIRHIREKIEIDPKNPRYLKVIWGIGYKIEKI